MKTPTVYIATLEDRERMALHPLDDRMEDEAGADGQEVDQRYPFPIVWCADWMQGVWRTSCLSSTAPSFDEVTRDGRSRAVNYGAGAGWAKGRTFDSDADAIAWLIEQEEARRAR